MEQLPIRSRNSPPARAGFTLLEVLVTLAVLGVLAAGVLGVYRATTLSTFFATASEAAQASARAGLDRMASELRAINAGRQGDTGAITAATPTSLTFLGIDIAAAATLTAAAPGGATTVQVSSATGFTVGKVLTIAPYAESRPISAVAGTTVTLASGLDYSYPAGSAVQTIETLTYTYTANGSSGRLTRSIGGVADTPLLDNLAGFQLTYWDGSVPAVQTAVLDQIREIRVQITTNARSGSQTVNRTMTATVRPRNLARVPGNPASGI